MSEWMKGFYYGLGFMLVGNILLGVIQGLRKRWRIQREMRRVR